MKKLRLKKIRLFYILVFAFIQLFGIHATAQIIYTHALPNQVIISSDISTYNFDLDNDGVTDFIFKESTSFVICRTDNTNICTATITPTNSNNAVMIDTNNLALALPDSSVINSDSLWSASSQPVTLFVSKLGNCAVGYSSKGHWLNNVPDKYIGLRLVKNGTTYYGWVRITCTRVSLASLYYATTLKDYAYINANTSDQPSITGQGAIATVHTAPPIQWQKTLGGSNDDYANSIQQTTDGSYIITGSSNSIDDDVVGNYAQYNTWIVKTDNIGHIQWQKIIGGSDTTENNFGGSFCIKQTSDGGYIAAGSYAVIKLDGSGNIQWQKDIGSSIGETANSIRQTSDGGYIVAGNASPNSGHGGIDFGITKLSSTGDIQWQKSLGGSSDDMANDVQQTIDGGYVVAGTSSSTDGDVTGNHGSTDYWIVKLDSSGNIQWQKSLGGSSADYALSIQQTTEGGYIVAGYSGSFDGDITRHHGSSSTGNYDAWLAKLNSSGAIEWQECFGGSDNDKAFSIEQTSEGGYIVGGISASVDGDADIDKSGNHGNYDAWVLKLNNNGNMQWQKSLGGSNVDGTYSIQQTTDGAYIAAGSTASYDGDISSNHGVDDYWIVKLGADIVVPVRLISFIGALQNNTTKLHWQTTNEINTADYIVERSSEATSFSAIGKVNAKQSSGITYSYNYTDDKPIQGVNYYRLKMEDKDGKFTYSNIIRIDLNTPYSPNVSPVPTHDMVTIAGAENFTTVQFIDVSGRIVKQFANMFNNIFPVEGLSNGVYYIRLSSKNNSQLLKMIKE